MPLRRTVAFACASGALLAAATTAVPARADVTIYPASLTRKVPVRSNPTTRTQISRSDCLGDDVINMQVRVDTPVSNFEVWVARGSANCTDRTARTGATASCSQIYGAAQGVATASIPLRVQDMAAMIIPDGRNKGTEASCDDTSGNTSAQDLTLYFMVVQSGDVQGAPATWNTKIDLVGPSAPANFKIDVGSQLLKAAWTNNSDPDVKGYSFFCDPPAGTLPPDAGGYNGRIWGGEVDGGADDAGGAGGASDAGNGDGASTGTGGTGGGTTGTGGAGGSGSGSNCTSTALVEGRLPDADTLALKCGEIAVGSATTSYIIKGLVNGTFTNVAVGAFDLIGNVGPLSNVACDAPEIVNGFDEAYRTAGGAAGGPGFCAVVSGAGRRSQAGWMGASFLAVALAAIFRRSRRGAASFDSESIK